MRISDWSSDVCSSDLASGPIDPALIPAIDAGPAVGPEFGILDVKAAYPLVIDVEEREIIELLEHEVARIEQQPCPRVPVHYLQKTLVGRAVVQILAGVDFIGEVDPVLLEHIEDRAPASAKLGESLLDEPRGPLRPGIDIRPGEGAGTGRVRRQADRK